jgi:hypothetical protein
MSSKTQWWSYIERIFVLSVRSARSHSPEHKEVQLSEDVNIRAMRVAAELAKTADLLAKAAAQAQIAAPLAAPAQLERGVPAALLDSADTFSRSSSAVAGAVSQLTDLVSGPIAQLAAPVAAR